MRTLPILLAALFLGACGAAHVEPTSPPPPASSLPHAARIAAPETPPESLPGVDTGDLTPRERASFWKLVGSLYAPCTAEAVSIAACVKEGRACAACAPAARLLARRVRAGASIADAERAYAARFGDKIVAVPVDDSPVAGPADAPVTIVVWTDFDCPHCRISLPLFEELREKYAPHVRVVHKLYPLRSHPNADGAARAAVAAAKQSRFWAMEKVLFDHQGDLGAAELDRYAELAGLDVARFRVDLASPEVAKVVARDRDEADAAGLDGTPYVVVNGRPVDLGVFHLRDELGPWIEAEIEIAKAKAAPKAAVAR